MYPGFHIVRGTVRVVVSAYICAYTSNIILLFFIDWFFITRQRISLEMALARRFTHSTFYFIRFPYKIFFNEHFKREALDKCPVSPPP
jgi:hypothetical protein